MVIGTDERLEGIRDGEGRAVSCVGGVGAGGLLSSFWTSDRVVTREKENEIRPGAGQYGR